MKLLRDAGGNIAPVFNGEFQWMRFLVLACAMLDLSSKLNIDDLPCILASLLVTGRTTNRRARYQPKRIIG